jgi:cytochrome c peroxidase
MQTVPCDALRAQPDRAACPWPRAAGILLAALAAFVVSHSGAAAATAQRDERARVLSLGPWPPAAVRDPSNRVSGHVDAVSFGRHMFYNPRPSANGYVACASCHQTDRAWTDNRARAQGLAPVDRNTPTLTNVAQNRLFGWGGASDSLWMASLRPMLDPREMSSSLARVAEVVRIGDGMACAYIKAFGRDPAQVDDETVAVDVAKALAAFQETLTSGRTPFDDYRDALARDDRTAQRRYPATARRGLALFVGRAGCVSCHAGPTFSDGSKRRAAARGLPADPLAEDAGRLRDSRYNRAGPFSDADTGRARSVASPSAEAGVRVPSLRNVAVTAPYMHDGSVDTLAQAVRHSGIRLLPSQVAELTAFLATLTDGPGERRPERLPHEASCD